MSLTFKVPVTATELEIEKRDQVVAPLKGGTLGGFLGWAAGMALHYFSLPKYQAFSLLSATPGVVLLTVAGLVGGAVIASCVLNSGNAAKITKDGAKLCKDKTYEITDKAVSVLDRFLPAPSDKAKANAAKKPQEPASKTMTPAREAARSRDANEQRYGGNIYNNCTFYGRDEEPRGRAEATSPAASRSKTPTRKSARSPARKK